jgi:hypothetical protein
VRIGQAQYWLHVVIPALASIRTKPILVPGAEGRYRLDPAKIPYLHQGVLMYWPIQAQA